MEVFGSLQECPDVDPSEGYVMELETPEGLITCMLIEPEGRERIIGEYEPGQVATSETVEPRPRLNEDSSGEAISDQTSFIIFAGILTVAGLGALAKGKKKAASRVAKFNFPVRAPDLSSSVAAAASLLGWKLVHQTPEVRIGGYIVETEAYHEDDPASHAYGGKRIRNAAMFERAGTIYVYFTYGMHFCMNIVTGREGHGEAVLIRALEPSDGLENMKQNRGKTEELQLTNGPAKLVQALGVTRQHSGLYINDSTIKLEPGFIPKDIVQTTRVGISKAVDKPWRFYVAGNRFVSKP